MTRISLGTMHARGIRLSPHEAIAVVHQVCELLKHGDDRGRPLAAPSLIELFVTEDGGVDIDPKRPIYDAAGAGSFRNLIDELLPLDGGDREKTSTRDAEEYAVPVNAHAFRFASNATGANERDLLRQLFERARRHVTPTGVPPIASAPTEPALVEPALTELAALQASTSLQLFDEGPIGAIEMPERSASDASEPLAIEFAAASDVAFADEVERAAHPSSPASTVAVSSSPFRITLARSDWVQGDAGRDDGALVFFDGPEREQRAAGADVSVDVSSDLYSPDVHAAARGNTGSSNPRFEHAAVEEPELGDPELEDPDFDNQEPDLEDIEYIEMGSGYAPPVVMRSRRRVGVLMTAAAMIVASVGVLIANLERSDPAWRDWDVRGLTSHVTQLTSQVTQQIRTLVEGTPSSSAASAVSPAASATTADVARAPAAALATPPGAGRDPVVRAAVPSLATPAEIAAVKRQRASYNAMPIDSLTASAAPGLIAFEDDRDGQPRGVYIDKQDGTGAVRVSGGGRAAAPTWSADRAYLSFVRTEPGRPDVWNLWVYRVGSGELRRLTANASGVVRGATWFPSGARLCYGHGSSIAVANVETGETRRYASPLSGRTVGRSSVSPNGRQVAFALERDGVWLLDLDSSRMRRVIEDADATDDVSWAARGGRLVYYSLSARGEGAWRGAPTETPTAFH